MVSQTERVRAQSQAQDEAADEAAANGFRFYDEWPCAMIQPHKAFAGRSSGSRESHMALDGKTALAGEAFHTIWGNELKYPGDPSAPAKEVINCHCTLIPHVLLPDENIMDGGVVKKARESLNNQGFDGIIKENSDTFILDWKQFGKKAGKHASDFGYDPSSEEDRQKVLAIIYDIKNNPTEKRIGYWRGQPDEVFFYIKGKDVVITKQTGEFVTIMKGGTANDRVKNARNAEI